MKMLKHTTTIGCCALLLAACDPSLTLDTGAALVVGQKASIKVNEGGDGAGLVENTLTLTDSAGRAYTSAEVKVSKVSDEEIQFTVPVGLAAGKGKLEVQTKDGFPFTGDLQINRLVVMRDLAGKLWLLAKTGPGTVAQFKEIAQGDGGENMGKGFGKVAIGPDGVLMASTAISSKTVKVAWLGATTKVSEKSATLKHQVNDVAVALKGQVLVGTSNGTYVIAKPTSASGSLDAKDRIDTGDTRALAVAGKANRAVALGWMAAGNRYMLKFLDVSSDDPAKAKVVGSIDDLGWKPQAGAVQAVAISADGKTTVAVNSKPTRVAVVREGATKAIAVTMPQNEQGPIDVTAAGSGLFYLLNGSSAPTPNVSVLKVDATAAKFDPPIKLEKATSDSGALVAVAASTAGDVIVLARHDMFLIDANKTVRAITFANLFGDKKTGEVGGTVAIQP